MLVNSIRRSIGKLHHDRGATAVEYALMIALIAMVIIAAVIVLGTSLSNLFNATAASL
jgi:pilus assembly protein Flp/PilA